MSPDPIGDVILAMDAARAELPPHDGIGVFIDVYRRVTEQVRLRVADGLFTDPRFVEHLDVVFAQIFLEVPQSVAAGRSVNPSWQPLADARGRDDLQPIQFALAGMNAHINHDLALAVVRACSDRGVSPHRAGIHDDYEKVNEVLAEVVRPIRQSFLDANVVAAGRPLSPLADLVSNFSIDKARDAAWVSALTLWEIRDVAFLERSLKQMLSRTVGLISRQLLVSFRDPLEHTQPFSEAQLADGLG